MPDFYSIIMQACWNGNPDMRPTSRDLERTFSGWIDSIANRQLDFNTIATPGRTVNGNSETNLTDSEFSIPSENSLPIPSLSVEQCKVLEELDKRGKYTFIDCLISAHCHHHFVDAPFFL